MLLQVMPWPWQLGGVFWQLASLQVVGSTQSNVDLFQANGGSGASPTHTLDLVWIIVGTGKGFAIRLVVFGQ